MSTKDVQQRPKENYPSLEDQRPPKTAWNFDMYYQSPNFKQESKASTEGAQEMANNFINSMMDELVARCKVEGDNEVKCDECGSNKLVLRCCPDCNVFLCYNCTDVHKCKKRFCGHSIASRNEVSEIDIEIELCAVHNTQLRYYCETCEQLVCMYCTVKDHCGHNHDTVMKMAGKYRHELKEVTASIEKAIAKVSEARVNIDKMRMKIRQQGDEVNKKIDQHCNELMENLVQIKQKGMCDKVNKGINQPYDELFRNLIDHKKRLKQQVHDTVTQKEKSVTARLQEVEYVQAEMVSLKEVKDAVERSSDQEAMSTKKDVMVHIQQITEKYKKLNTQPVKLVSMEFVPSQNPFPQFGQLFVHVINTKHPLAFINDVHTKTTSVIPYTTLSKPSKIVRTDQKVDYPWGIEFCENGTWAVTLFTKHCVCIFDKQDILVRKFGGKGSNDKQFYHPCGIAFEGTDHLYVADRDNHRIQKFNVKGNYLLMFGGRGSKDGKLEFPCGITVHKGSVFVADSENSRISVFHSNGQFRRTIGEGHLDCPHDLAVTDDHLVIADYGKHCICTFTVEGHFVSKFGTRGTGNKELCSPRGLTVDSKGFILVTDKNCRVSIFSKDGNCVHQFGACGSDGGQFYKHSGIAISLDGDIYVCDGGNHRVQIFYIKP